jgi:hypothetical protein
MKTRLRSLAIALALTVGMHQAAAQGTTAFIYQGQLLENGTNVNGACPMIFKLYDALNGGNQIGASITTTPVLSNGLFSVALDFGAGAFDGSARWLDITVSNGVAQALSPRAQVLPSPYAQFAAVAATVTNAAIMNAQLADGAVNSNNIASGQVVKSLNGLADAVSLTAGANVTITPSGNTLQIAASNGGGIVVTNTLAAGNNVGLFSNGGMVQISSFVPNIQLFQTNGTFTVPTNVTRIMVEMWGAGGGGGSGFNDGADMNSGGGGGSGAYTFNAFTVTPGSSYSVAAGGSRPAGQSGVASGFSGPGISMMAGGGSAGGNATANVSGAGGANGLETGGLIQAGDTGQPGAGLNGGGQGAGVWRGSPGSYSDVGGNHQAISGPGGGGGGGGPGGPGGNGQGGMVIIYY